MLFIFVFANPRNITIQGFARVASFNIDPNVSEYFLSKTQIEIARIFVFYFSKMY